MTFHPAVRTLLGAAALLMSAGLPSHATQTGTNSAGAGMGAPLSARAAGARYGQAAGVALVCFGVRITTAAEALKARYSGADLAQFSEEAEAVLAGWRDLLSCRKSTGPNECRLSHDWSCRDALREIGPAGSALPGLVDVP